MSGPSSGAPEPTARDRRAARYWDRQAASYDERTAGVERRFLADSRRWVCERAAGETLEVAVGTGANLSLYPAGVRLTALDRSPAMLDAARRRADALGREARLVSGDAGALPFAAASFDAIVCTYALCGMPDERQALTEMVRVLRPHGRLLLADHVVATNPLVRGLERLLELVTVPLQGEHYTRRPLTVVRAMGLAVVETDRLRAGAIERLHATAAPVSGGHR